MADKGSKDFIPDFGRRFAEVNRSISEIDNEIIAEAGTKIIDIRIPELGFASQPSK